MIYAQCSDVARSENLGGQVIKFGYSEKATKFEKNLPRKI